LQGFFATWGNLTQLAKTGNKQIVDLAVAGSNPVSHPGLNNPRKRLNLKDV
jgi:hypothetical protein